MYWKQGDNRIAVPTLPMLTIGEDYDTQLTLVTEAGEDLERVILCCLNAQDAGLISAKKASESEYHSIGTLFDPECYLGGILAESETAIDFRVNCPEGTSDGLHLIPITLLYGDLISGPTSIWQVTVSSVWQDPDDAPIWRDPREV